MKPFLFILTFLLINTFVLNQAATDDSTGCYSQAPDTRTVKWNPGTYYGNGSLTPRVCRYECARIVPIPTTAMLSNGLCYCSNNTISGTQNDTLCTLDCISHGTNRCGSNGNVWFSSYNVTQPLVGTSLTLTPSVSCQSVIGYSVTVPKGTPATRTYITSINPTEIVTIYNNSASVLLHAIGDVAMKVTLTDAENNMDTANAKTKLYTKIYKADFLNGEIQTQNTDFDVQITVRVGSEMSGSMDFGNGQTVTLPTIPSALPVFIGDYSEVDSNVAADATKVYFMPNSVFKYNATVTAIKLHAQATGTFLLQIWRPDCGAAGTDRYCYHPNKCVATHLPCSSESEDARTIQCSNPNKYSIQKRSCVDTSGQEVSPGPTNSLDKTSMVFVQEITVAIFTTGMNEILLSQNNYLIVEAGDVPAIAYPGSPTITRKVASNGIQEISIASSSITNYASRSSSRVVATGLTTAASEKHMIQLLAHKTVLLSLRHKYGNHSCSDNPPTCKEESYYNATLTINNYCNQSVIITKQFEVQVAITNVTFNCDSKYMTFWPMNFTVPPHPGSKTVYTWQFGDGRTLVTQDMAVKHTYIRPDIYNVSLCCANNVSEVCVWKSIVVQNSIEGVVASVDNGPGTVYGVATPLEIGYSQGTNVTMEIEWDDGTALQSFTFSDESPAFYAVDQPFHVRSNVKLVHPNVSAANPENIAAATIAACQQEMLSSTKIIKSAHFDATNSKCIMYEDDILYDVNFVQTKSGDSVIYWRNQSCSLNLVDFKINSTDAAGNFADISGNGWEAASASDYLVIKSMGLIDIHMFTIRGHGTLSKFTSSFSVNQSITGADGNWTASNTFTANSDTNTPVTVKFNPPLSGRYFRIIPTNANAAIRLSMKACHALRKKETKTKVQNQALDKMMYKISVRLNNLISEYNTSFYWPVQRQIVNFQIVEPGALAFGLAPTVNLTADNGNDFKMDSTFNNILLAYNLVVMPNDQNGFMVGTCTLNPSLIPAVGTYMLNVTADNYVTTTAITSSKNVLIEYPVDGFAITGVWATLLRRPSNTTIALSYHLCLNKTIKANRLPSNVVYTMIFGDNTAETASTSVTCNSASEPANQNWCPKIHADYEFCQTTHTHVYTSSGNYKVNVSLSNSVSQVSYAFDHLVFSQVTNLVKQAELHPMYVGDALKASAKDLGIYPLENFVTFNAIMQFGTETSLTYTWDFGDGSTPVSAVDVAQANHTFQRTGWYNITVNATNPVSNLVAFGIIKMEMSIINAQLSSKVPYTMKTSYIVEVKADAMGTDACYFLDFSEWGAFVSANKSYTVFGNRSYCESTDFVKHAYTSANWDNYATAQYLDAQNAYELAGTADKKPMTIYVYKNVTNYGTKTIKLYASNKVSKFESDWQMTVSRGPCSYPKLNLNGMISKSFARDEAFTVDSFAVLNCYNMTTHIEWKVSKLDSGNWVDYYSDLLYYWNKFPLFTGNTLNKTLDYYMTGIMSPKNALNVHLTKLKFYKYNFKLGTYRITAFFKMVEEPNLSVNETVEITIAATPLVPVVTGTFFDTETNKDYTVETPAQVKWENLMTINCGDSKDRDLFVEDGETQDLRYEWYCYQECEQKINWTTPDRTYNKNLQTAGDTACETQKMGDNFVTKRSCFTRGVWQDYLNFLPHIGKSQWQFSTHAAAKASSQTGINRIYNGGVTNMDSDQPGIWLTAVTENKPNYLYYTNGTRNEKLLLNTKWMYEGKKHYVVCVVRDNKGVKVSQEKIFQLGLTSGTPPIVSSICISNCKKGIINIPDGTGGTCEDEVIKINNKSPLKFQMNIENWSPSSDYFYRWKVTDLNRPINKCQKDLTADDIVKALNDQIISPIGRQWITLEGTSHSSTGIDGPGLSVDNALPFPPFNRSMRTSYYLLQAETSRDVNFNNTGSKFVFIAANDAPNIDNLTVSVTPSDGIGLETDFTVKCGGATDIDTPVTYSIGYSMKSDPATSDCTWILQNSLTCEIIDTKLPASIHADQHLRICILVMDNVKTDNFNNRQLIKVKNKVLNTAETDSLVASVDNLAGSGNLNSFGALAFALTTSLNSDTPAASTGTGGGAATTGTGTTSSSTTTTPTTTDPNVPPPTTTPMSEAEKQKLIEEKNKKKQVREKLITSVKSITSANTDTKFSLDDTKTVIGVLSNCVKKTDELTDNSVDTAAEVTEFFASKILDSSTDESTDAGAVIDACFPLFETTSSLLDATVPATTTTTTTDTNSNSQNTDSNAQNTDTNTATLTEEEKKQQKQAKFQKQQKINKRVFSIIKAGAQAILNKKVLGEKSTKLNINGISMDIKKEETQKMTDGAITPGDETDCGGILMGDNTNGKESVFLEQDRYDPNKRSKAKAVNSQLTTTKNNMYGLASGGGENVTSKTFLLKFENDKKETFNITETDANSAMEVMLTTSDGKEGTKSVYVETTGIEKRMASQITQVNIFNGLFVRLERYLNYTEIMENITGTLTPLKILLNNHTYHSGEFQFQVFVREDKAPTEKEYDHYCELPITNPAPCVPPKQVPPTNATVTESVATNETTTTAQPPTGEEFQCLCGKDSVSGVIENCTKYESNITTTAASSNVSISSTTILTIEKCWCNDTGCSYMSDPVTAAPTVEKCQQKWKYAHKWTCFFPPEKLSTHNSTKKFYIGVRAVKPANASYETTTTTTTKSGDPTPAAQTGPPNREVPKYRYINVGYQSTIYTTGCFFFNETSESLENTGLRLGACSNPGLTQCFTTHLTAFMASFYVPPIQFNPNDSAWLKLDSNPIALALCLSLVCFYFIILIWARKRDKEDQVKVGVTPLPDNDPRDEFEYELTFWTGARAGGGTTAQVSLILSGDEGDTLPRWIRDPERLTLQRGETDTFLMKTPIYLGSLTHMRIWHDNTGPAADWYFSRLLVEDLQTKDKYYFICNRWFAIDKDDGMVDRVMPVSGKEEINGFENVFWTRSQKNLYDGHIWFSVVTRPARSKFTRVQRTTACLCLLMSTMMVNLMFYNQSGKVESPKLIEIGPVKFTPHSIYLATVCTLIILPINLIIVILFKNRRDKVKVKPGFENHHSKQTEMNAGKGDQSHLFQSTSSMNSELRKELENLDKRPNTADLGGIQVVSDGKQSNQTNIPLSQLQEVNPQGYADIPAEVRASNVALDTTGKHKKKGCLASIKATVKNIFPLPWWSYIIGYILSFCTVCVCTYLMVEFAGVLGEAKTAEWLGSMAMTLVQSIILVQPIKILVIGLLYAIVLKKPEEDTDETSKEMMLSGMEPMHKTITMRDLTNPETIKELTKNKHSAPPPPDAQLLAMQREKRLHEIKMQALIKDIIFYIFFLVMLMMCAYTNQDYRSFLQNDQIRKSLTDATHVLANQEATQTFESVLNYQTAYEYINFTFIPTLYPVDCYEGTKCKLVTSSNWTMDPAHLLVRQAQLRQVRIPKKSKCAISEYFVSSFVKCMDEYSLISEDDEDYSPYWILFNDSDTTMKKQKSWSFTSALDTYGYPFSGELGTYGGGGYIAELGRSRVGAQGILNSLYENNWLDRQTRGLFMEALIYNANTNLYTYIMMLVEFFQGGGVVRQPKVYTFKLDRYVGVNAVFFLALDIISVIFIAIFIYRECRELHRTKCDYFKDFFNILDFSLVIVSITEIVLYAVRIIVQKVVSYYMKKYPERFINFQWLIMWDELNQFFLGMIVFIFTIRFLRLLSFNRKIMMLAEVLKRSAKPLGYFAIVFALCFFAFMQAGYLLFYKVVDAFKTPVTSLETLSVMTLNKFDFTKFAVGGGVLGLVFFFIYMLFISFILVNFFLVIILDSFTKVKESWKDAANEYEIVDYISSSMRKAFGCGDKDKGRLVDQRFAYIAEEMNLEDKDPEIQLKVDTLVERLMVMMHGTDASKSAEKERLKRQKDLESKQRVFM